MKKRRKILLMMGSYVPRIHLGVAKYAREAGWILDASMVFSGQIPEYWHGDGILAITTAARADITAKIKNEKLPCVDMGDANILNMPNVINDHKGIGKMAAEFLVTQGFQHIALALFNDSMLTNKRYKAAREVIEESGRKCYLLDVNKLENSLKELPRQLAVVTMGDNYAVQLLHMLEDLEVEVPTEVAVIGAGDRPLINELAPVPLTSVHNNQVKRGYEAAKLLDKLIDGEDRPVEPILIPPKGVIERMSTDVAALPHPAAAKAVSIIKQRFSDKELTPGIVAFECHISRRALDTAFIKYTSLSIDSTIRKYRLEKSTRMLVESNEKLTYIAAVSGFSSPEHMYKTFIRQFGISPREYRLNHDELRELNMMNEEW